MNEHRTVEIRECVSKKEFLAEFAKVNTGEARATPTESAIVREIKERIIAAVVRGLHDSGALAPSFTRDVKAEALAEVLGPAIAKEIRKGGKR